MTYSVDLEFYIGQQTVLGDRLLVHIHYGLLSAWWAFLLLPCAVCCWGGRHGWSPCPPLGRGPSGGDR